MGCRDMKWVFALALLFGALSPLSEAYAEEPADANSFVRNFILRSVHIRTDNALTPDQRTRASRALLEECYDVANVPRTVLGRYWDKATAEQQERYMALFEDYLLASYGPKFDAIADRLVVMASDTEGSRVVVHTQDAVRPDSLMVVDWILAQAGDGHWRIADVRVNGASSVEVMRQEFTSVLRANNGDIDALLSALVRQIELLRKTPA